MVRPGSTEQKALEVLESLPSVLRLVRTPEAALDALTDLTRRVLDVDVAAATLVGEPGSPGLSSLSRAGAVASSPATPTACRELTDLLDDLMAGLPVVRVDDLGPTTRPATTPATTSGTTPALRCLLGTRLMAGPHPVGLLYVGDHNEPRRWTLAEENLLATLGRTFGAALGNAHVLRDAVRARRWMRAANGLTADVLTSDLGEPLRIVADRARALAEADVVAMLMVADGVVRVRYAQGLGAEDTLTGAGYPLEPGTWAHRVITEDRGEAIVDLAVAPDRALNELGGVRLGPGMLLPLHGTSTVVGALLLARRAGAARFGSAELEVAGGFAHHVAVILELASSRLVQDQLRLLEERNRIARDLHDHVVQRLFATGLSLQQIVPHLVDGPRQRAGEAVVALDETIRQIRTTILTLHTPEDEITSLESLVLRIAREVTPLLGFAPLVALDPPTGELTGPLAGDLAVSVREGLSNVVRHAHASVVEIRAAVVDDELRLTLCDNGLGIHSDRRSGLRNLAERMQQHRGTFRATAPASGGTLLSWTVPYRVARVSGR